MVIKPQFTGAKNFGDGLAPVSIGGHMVDGTIQGAKWGFINKAGKMIIKPRFDAAESFLGGLARVNVGGGKWGYIDKTGKWVWKPTE